MKPKLLDLFCGAGGCAVGYSRAGFDVVGVDSKPQPRYPFQFVQMDALEVLDILSRDHWYIETEDNDKPYFGRDFAAVHASPPCQRYSQLTNRWGVQKKHPALIAKTRDRLKRLGLPWVMENVEGSPLRKPVMLCGSMFELTTISRSHYLKRHRLFECSRPLHCGLKCSHGKQAISVVGNGGGCSTRDNLRFCSVQQRREAMGIGWMTNVEMSQSIPPAYTEFIGRQLIQYIARE